MKFAVYFGNRGITFEYKHKSHHGYNGNCKCYHNGAFYSLASI